jgi:hypothetical protein
MPAEEYREIGKGAKRKMMNEWNYGIKRNFRANEAESNWHVDIPGYLGRHEIKALEPILKSDDIPQEPDFERSDPGTVFITRYENH